MTVRARDLRYPLLCLTRTLGVCLVQSAAELERCRAVVYWRGRFFDDLRIVDASGDTHIVVRASIRKPRSPLGQRLARLLDLPLQVDVEARRDTRVSIEEVRAIVSKAVDEDAEAFEEFSGKDVDWWNQSLSRCTTIEELMRLIAGLRAHQ
jgi:hypothetical protein